MDLLKSLIKDTTNLEEKIPKNEIIVTLIGAPGVGKSTIFNELTGLNNQSENCNESTISVVGKYLHNGKNYRLVDLPSTYSIYKRTAPSEVTRNFVFVSSPTLNVVVLDATKLFEQLPLALELIEFKKNVVVCINQIDKIRESYIEIDQHELNLLLGVPVCLTSATSSKGILELKNIIEDTAHLKRRTFQTNIVYHCYIEKSINIVIGHIVQLKTNFNPRWLALNFLLDTEYNSQYLKRMIDWDYSNIKEILLAKEYLNEQGIDNDVLVNLIQRARVEKAEQLLNNCIFDFKNSTNYKKYWIEKCFRFLRKNKDNLE